MLTHPVQELCQLGILYDQDGLDPPRAMSASSFSWNVSVQASSPAFSTRQVNSRRLRRRPTWQGLPLKLSLSNLRDDYDIALLLSPVYGLLPSVPSNVETEQCQAPPTYSADESFKSQQSLPELSVSLPTLVSSPTTTSVEELSISLPQSSILPLSLMHEDWTFITPKTSLQELTYPSIASTPFSEPETWILLGDDLQQTASC